MRNKIFESGGLEFETDGRSMCVYIPGEDPLMDLTAETSCAISPLVKI